MEETLNPLQLQRLQLLLHLFEDEFRIEGCFFPGDTYIEGQEKKYEDFREKFREVLFPLGPEDVEKPLGHDHGRIVADNRENILYPFIDPLPDGRSDGFIVEFDRYLLCGEVEFPMVPIRSFRDIMIANDIGSRFMDKREGSNDDMGRGSGIEERKDMGDNGIISLRCDDLAQTDMEVVVVTPRFPFVLLGSLDPREGFRSFCLGCFRLLFCSSFGTTFFTVEIIESVESHK